MEHIVIVGAGAIGSLYGARLSTRYPVTLVARQAHVDAIGRDGLKVIGLPPEVYHPRAVPHLDAIAPRTLLLLTTKVADNDAAMQPIAPLVRDDTVIVCLQNGLGGEDIVRGVVGDRPMVLRGITNFGAIFRGPGVIEFKAAAQTVLQDSPMSDGIAAMMTACGLEGRVSPNIRVEVWRKLLFNCVINPITSITGREVGSIADERLDPVKSLVIDECVAVAKAEGVVLDEDYLGVIARTFGPSPNTASMRQDLQRGRRTEIDFMNGAVADLGERHGIDCPVNRALAMIIRSMERQAAADRAATSAC